MPQIVTTSLFLRAHGRCTTFGCRKRSEPNAPLATNPELGVQEANVAALDRDTLPNYLGSLIAAGLILSPTECCDCCRAPRGLDLAPHTLGSIRPQRIGRTCGFTPMVRTWSLLSPAEFSAGVTGSTGPIQCG